MRIEAEHGLTQDQHGKQDQQHFRNHVEASQGFDDDPTTDEIGQASAGDNRWISYTVEIG